MRSNDAYIGLSHDIFAFTMLQELVARTLDLDLGTYNHSVASLHLYDKDKNSALEYLSEGFQSTKITMPEMPFGNPWNAIEQIMIAEADIRNFKNIDAEKLGLEQYWTNLIYLLLIHSSFKKNEIGIVTELQKKIDDTMYNTYIDSRLKRNIQSRQV
jgi:thymidylate synthase